MNVKRVQFKCRVLLCWPAGVWRGGATIVEPAQAGGDIPDNHRLNVELNLQSLFGPLCTAALIGWDPATHPSPRIWAHIRGRSWSAKIDDIFLWPPADNIRYSTVQKAWRACLRINITCFHCGTVTFWYGSRSGDPYFWITDPDLIRLRIRILLFSLVTFKVATKIIFFSKFYCLLPYFLKLHLHNFSKIKSHKKATKQ